MCKQGDCVLHIHSLRTCIILTKGWNTCLSKLCGSLSCSTFKMLRATINLHTNTIREQRAFCKSGRGLTLRCMVLVIIEGIVYRKAHAQIPGLPRKSSFSPEACSAVFHVATPSLNAMLLLLVRSAYVYLLLYSISMKREVKKEQHLLPRKCALHPLPSVRLWRW
jgi:hypothetical protein